MTKPPIVLGRKGAVAKAMQESKLSLRELEEKTRVSRSTINNVARDVSPIAKDKAERIATALGRPVGTLFVHKDGAPLGGA